MRKIFLGMSFILLLSGVVKMQGQEARIIRDVVLLNIEPYEVLMTEKGDILSKIRSIPDYLTSDKVIKKESNKSEIAISHDVASKEETKAENILTSYTKKEKRTISPVINNEIRRDYFEVEFIQGTATLTSKAISTLNELASILKSNRQQSVQIFGFQNESPQIASLLSKRRRDACVAYLKIKGVKTRDQLSLGSITRGTNNKIVFGFE